MDGNLESLDYHLRQMETNEKENAEIYEDLKEQFQQAIDDCIAQAKRDEIEIDDIIDAVQFGLDDNLSLNDGLITIYRVRV